VQACDTKKHVLRPTGHCEYGDSVVLGRDSAGAGGAAATPSAIVPTAIEFAAWYGNWSDTNGDGAIQNFDRTINGAANPANEFDANTKVASGRNFVAFVDPGSHPTLDSNSRPVD
jgi:hypothetical protein